MGQRSESGARHRGVESQARDVERRKAQLFELEQAVQEEREQLEHERSELGERSASLQEAENLVVERDELGGAFTGRVGSAA